MGILKAELPHRQAFELALEMLECRDPRDQGILAAETMIRRSKVAGEGYTA